MSKKPKKPYNTKLSFEQMNKTITQEEKINYLRIALSIQQIGITEEMADRIIETYEAIMKLGGKFSVEDAVKIEMYIKDKYAKKSIDKRKT